MTEYSLTLQEVATVGEFYDEYNTHYADYFGIQGE